MKIQFAALFLLLAASTEARRSVPTPQGKPFVKYVSSPYDIELHCEEDCNAVQQVKNVKKPKALPRKPAFVTRKHNIMKSVQEAMEADLE